MFKAQDVSLDLVIETLIDFAINANAQGGAKPFCEDIFLSMCSISCDLSIRAISSIRDSEASLVDLNALFEAACMALHFLDADKLADDFNSVFETITQQRNAFYLVNLVFALLSSKRFVSKLAPYVTIIMDYQDDHVRRRSVIEAYISACEKFRDIDSLRAINVGFNSLKSDYVKSEVVDILKRIDVAIESVEKSSE